MSRRGDVPDRYNSERGDGEMGSEYLKQRGRTWYVRVPVPKHLQRPQGPREVVRSLKTRSKAEAQRLRWPVIAEIMDSFDRQQRLPDTEKALEFARRLQGPMDCVERENLELQVYEHAEGIEEDAGLPRAKRWFDVAVGKGVPVSYVLAKFLADRTGDLNEQTAGQYQSDIDEFIAHSGDHILSDVSRRTAGAYVSDHLTAPRSNGKRLAGKTLNRKVSALSALWKWALRRGFAEDNPWSDQGRSKAFIEKEQRRKPLRPFSPEELRKIIEPGPEDEVLRDLIWISLFTGARIEEICALRPGDVQDGWFHIRDGKTKSADRWLPIPEPLTSIFEARARNECWLFSDVKPGRRGKKRSHNVDKRVNRWLVKALEDPEAQAFHSFRRSYATACEHVGLHPDTWAELMGHKKQTLAASLYSGGQSREQLYEAQAQVSNYVLKYWLEC